MNKVYILVILLLSGVDIFGQNVPTSFDDAVDKGQYPPTGIPTCGVYTYNPRVDGDFYVVDLYGRRCSESAWTSQHQEGRPVVTYDLSGIIGAFGIAFQMEHGESYFSNKFESFIFDLNPELTLYDVDYNEDVPLVEIDKEVDVTSSTTQLALALKQSSSQPGTIGYLVSVDPSCRMQVDVPFYVGTLKMKIKSSAKNLKAGFYLLPSACSIAVWDPSADLRYSVASSAISICGWLDGKDPNIPLTAQEETTVPEDPAVPTGPTPVCAGLEGVYAINALPKNAGLTTWKVFDAGGVEVSSSVAELTLGTDKKSVTVKWHQAGSYQVKVWGKNATTNEESANPAVLNVTVNTSPAIALQRDNVLITTEAQKTVCSGVEFKLSVAQVTGATYEWQDGTTISTYYTETPVNKGNTDITKKYKVTATLNGCPASDSVVMTIFQEPDCVFQPETTSHPAGSLLERSLLCNNNSSPVTEYSWTSPKTSTESSIEFELPAGGTDVIVTAKNAKGCSQTFTQHISDNGQGLQAEVVSVYGNEICQGGAALLKATLTRTAGGAPYTFKWYKGKDALGELIATHEVNTLEDFLTVNQFDANSGIFYSVKITNSSMLSVTVNSPELTVNSGKTPPVIQTESPLVAATPDKRVLLYATTTSGGSPSWQWLPKAGIEGGNNEVQYAMTTPVNEATTYTVLLRNAVDGCVNKADVEVRLPGDNLAMNVSPESWTLCQNGSIQLNTTVTGGNGSGPSYKWTSLSLTGPGSISNLNIGNPKYTASADGSGTHEYMLRVQKGEQVVTTKVTIEVKGQKVPQLALGDVFCSDSNLLATNTGGAASGYEWFIRTPENNWVSRATDAPVYPFAHDPGTYDVKVIAKVADAGCVSDTVVRTGVEVKRPTVTQQVIPTVFPKGSDITSTATANNGWGNYTYDWVVTGKSGSTLPEQNTASNEYKITGADEDSYTFNLTVKDEKGCQAVSQPGVATANGDGMDVQLALVDKYCQNGSALLGATVTGGRAPYTYTWKTAEGNVLETVSSSETTLTYFIPAGSVVGGYQLTVTDAATPSVLTITRKLELTPENLSVPVVTTEGTIKVLPNTPAVLRAELSVPTQGEYRWQWMGDQLSTAEAQKQYAQTGALTGDQTYQVYVVDKNGCISAPATENVEIDNTNGFSVNIIALLETMCKNTRQQLEAITAPEQSGATYAWASIPENLFSAASESQQKPEINPTAAGNYRVVVTVQNAAGVKNTAKVDITVKPQTPPQLTWNYNECQGDVVKISTPDAIIANGYTWYVDGTEILDNKTNELLITADGEHTIRVIAEGTNDCKADEEKTYTVKTQPVLTWDPEPTGIEVNVPFTAQVKASPSSGDFEYTWDKPASGTPSGRTCRVTAGAVDRTIDFQVYALDRTTGCKTNTLEKTVNVENDVITPNVSVLNNKVCKGGAAVLEVVTVSGSDGPFNYEWKKVGSTEVLGTQSKLVVPQVNGPETYTVTVTVVGKTKKGTQTVPLNPVEGTVPALTPYDINVAPGNSAILVAGVESASIAANLSWYWAPVERLASAAECHRKYPETMVFPNTGDSVFTVYAVDRVGGCISPQKELIVHIQNNDVFTISLSPDRPLCIGNKETYTAEISGGKGEVRSSVWLAGQSIQVSEESKLQAVYTAGQAGTDTIAVVVDKGFLKATAKQVVTIQNKQAPNLEFAPVNPCQDSILVVRADNGSALKNYNWKITKDGAALADVTTDRFSMSQTGVYTLHITATAGNDCPANALVEKEFTVYPNPVITNVLLDTDCDTTRLAAVTTDGDSWAWTKKGTGITGYAQDSILVLPHATDALSKTYEYTVVASNVHGCRSESASKMGTVYTLPVITMNPVQKNLYPGKDLTIEATLSPALSYTSVWAEAANIADQLTATKIKTTSLAIGDYAFTFTVTNPENVSCQKTGVTNVHVTDADMKVEFANLGDSLEVCDGTKYIFKADVVNNMTDVTYAFEVTDPAGHTVRTPSADGTFEKIFNLQENNRYQVYAIVTDAESNVRRDTVVVKVNPNPTIQFKDESTWGKEFKLCEHKGQVDIGLEVTGTATWNLYYKVGNTSQVKHLTSAQETLSVMAGGDVVIDSIVDAKGCKEVKSDYGFSVLDDIPKLTLTAENLNICQNTETDLGIQISAKNTDYPLEIFARRGMKKENRTMASATDVVTFDLGTNTPPRTVNFIVDSIRSARGCVFKLQTPQNKVVVSEYTDTNPKLTLADKSKRYFCEGDTVKMPVQISGGKPEYTISYRVGDKTGEKKWTAEDNKIALYTPGTFRITALKDGNGCGIFEATDTVDLIRYETPSMQINNSSMQMCGGELNLDITLAKGTAPYTIYYTKDNGAELTHEIAAVDANRKASWTLTEAGNYVITKVTDQHCQIAGTKVTGGPELPVTPLRLYAKMKSNETVCATPGASIEIDFSGTVWGDVKGNVQLAYDFTPASGGTTEHKTIDFTLVDAQKVNPGPAISPVPQGTYVLTAVTDLGANSCGGLLSEVESENQITVIDAPVVQIDSLDFAAAKDEAFVLGVKDPDGDRFKYAWQVNDGTFTEATAPYAKSDVMGDTDLQYVLKAINKTATSCFSTDTVNVFRIPDAPTLTIDTNHTRNDLELSWEMPTGQIVDGYLIWSNRWDAYAMETPYEIGADLPSTANSFPISEAVIEQDTLKFFYMQAVRNIKRAGVTKKYTSAVSDTVGFYGIALKTYEGSNYTLVPYLFDMSSKIQTTVDFVNLLGGKDYVQAIQKFSTTDQGWTVSRYSPFPPPGAWVGGMDMKVGDVYMLDMVRETKLVMYGKVHRQSFELEQGESSSFNVIYLPFEKSDKRNAISVVGDIGGNAAARGLQTWIPATQEWIILRYTPFPPPGQWINDFRIYPGCPFMIDVVNSMIWR